MVTSDPLGMPEMWLKQGRGPEARPRADPGAALLLVIGGAAGVAQLLLPWRTFSGGNTITGWQVFRLMRAVPNPTLDLTIARLAVLAVAIGGAALVLLGLATLAPISHRPLGLAALLVAGVSAAGAGWILARSPQLFDVGWRELFLHSQVGWYLFLASGIISIFGGVRAIAVG